MILADKTGESAFNDKRTDGGMRNKSISVIHTIMANGRSCRRVDQEKRNGIRAHPVHEILHTEDVRPDIRAAQMRNIT